MWTLSASLYSRASRISATLTNSEEENTEPEYISSETRWIFFSVTKSRRCSKIERWTVAPKGFEGFVINTPLTFVFMASASLYAASKAWGVIWKLFELSQWIGTTFTPVLHLKSLSNLSTKTKKMFRLKIHTHVLLNTF